MLKFEVCVGHARTSRLRSREGDHPKITRVADLKPIAAWRADFAAGAVFKGCMRSPYAHIGREDMQIGDALETRET
jgi:hypothetical protein